MQPIIYKINLDLHESNSQYFLKLSRGDVGSEIRATFNEAGKSYSLENCTCKFSALKGDGNYIYNDCTVNTESNYVSYIITDQTTAACGVEKCQLIVIGNDGKIKAAPKFELIIEDKIYDEQEIIDSTSEFNTITSLQSSVSTNTSNISTNANNISALQSAVSTNSSNISTLQTEIQGTGTSIALSINNSTYVMTLQLKNSQGNVLSSGTVDLPLETMVVGASYDSANKSIILTLQSGSTVSFSVADLVSGLVSESDLNTALSTLQSSISTNANNISTLQSAVSDLEDDKADWAEVYTMEEVNDYFVLKSYYHWGAGLTTYDNMYGKTISVDMDPTSEFNTINKLQTGVETNKSNISTLQTVVSAKQGTLTAGTNISISNDVISATDTTYSNATTSSAGLMSSTDKAKLNGIASGAEVNVQANWNETDTTSDSYIQNKPAIPDVTNMEVETNKVTTISSASTNTQYPSAKAVYDYIQALNGNGVNY